MNNKRIAIACSLMAAFLLAIPAPAVAATTAAQLELPPNLLAKLNAMNIDLATCPVTWIDDDWEWTIEAIHFDSLAYIAVGCADNCVIVTEMGVMAIETSPSLTAWVVHGEFLGIEFYSNSIFAPASAPNCEFPDGLDDAIFGEGYALRVNNIGAVRITGTG